MTTGPISVGTDCATVLSRAQMLQAHSYDKAIARKFDNADLWYLLCDVSLGHEMSRGCGEVRFFKVTGHVAKGDSRQRGLKETPKRTLPLNKWRMNVFLLNCLCLRLTSKKRFVSKRTLFVLWLRGLRRLFLLL